VQCVARGPQVAAGATDGASGRTVQHALLRLAVPAELPRAAQVHRSAHGRLEAERRWPERARRHGDRGTPGERRAQNGQGHRDAGDARVQPTRSAVLHRRAERQCRDPLRGRLRRPDPLLPEGHRRGVHGRPSLRPGQVPQVRVGCGQGVHREERVRGSRGVLPVPI